MITLLEERRRVKMARGRLRSMKGILRGREEAVETLISELRDHEGERLERLRRSAQETLS